MFFYPHYYFKTLLYAVAGSQVGHYHALRRYKNPSYDYQRDRHPVRRRHNAEQGWQTPNLKRQYESYEEYLTHQAQKYQEIIQLYGGFSGYTLLTWRQRFYRRFRYLPSCLPPDALILCLGARQGTEVEVLRDLGFSRAYGIDLNPGPDNPYVEVGDFMHLTEPDGSIDLIYTNSVDHAFDLDNFVAEHRRVLTPNGLAIYDLPRYGGSRRAGAFEAIGWRSEDEVIDRLRASFNTMVRSQQEKKWHWVMLQGPRPPQA